ncbi:MAG: hypothetical protein JST65_19830 [Acidobacteria bacterium]|nr:hypothetical protein [Acidobacteriota bacterium]
MQRIVFTLFLLASSASADILLDQPLVFINGRTSQVTSNNTGYITWDRIQLSQNSYVNQISWVGGFFALGASTAPTPQADYWLFQVASDNNGVPGAVTDSVKVPFSSASRQLIASGALGGMPANFYRLDISLPATLFVAGRGIPQWFTIQALGDGPSTFSWISGSGGDGVAKQLDLSSGSYTSFRDRSLQLSGIAAVPEPRCELLLLSVLFAGRRFRIRA